MLRTRILNFLIAALTLSIGSQADTTSGIVVRMSVPENAWADTRLGDKLDWHLSSISHVPISRDYNSRVSMATPHFEELAETGSNLDGRFLIDIRIDRIGLEKRKVTVIPQIIFRYRVYGVITGKIRIVDLKKSRVIEMSDFSCEEKASDRWQFVDDDANDSDLRISSDQKILFFDELEEKAALKIFQQIKRLIRSNDFGG